MNERANKGKFYLAPLLHSSQYLIRILFLSANPVDEQQINVTEEFNRIAKKLRESRYRNQFKLVPKFDIPLKDLAGVLLDEEKAQIFHFSGHGSQQSSLIFRDDHGQSQEAPPDFLTGLFKIFRDRSDIRCVVLNACYSEKQAKAVAKYVDSVVGMTRAITDDAAKDFAVYFYEALGAGTSIKFAFDHGCNQLRLLNIPEEQTPKLNERDGVDAASLVLVKRKQRVGNRPPNENNSIAAVGAGSFNRGSRLLVSSVTKPAPQIQVLSASDQSVNPSQTNPDQAIIVLKQDIMDKGRYFVKMIDGMTMVVRESLAHNTLKVTAQAHLLTVKQFQHDYTTLSTDIKRYFPNTWKELSSKYNLLIKMIERLKQRFDDIVKKGNVDSKIDSIMTSIETLDDQFWSITIKGVLEE